MFKFNSKLFKNISLLIISDKIQIIKIIKYILILIFWVKILLKIKEIVYINRISIPPIIIKNKM